jgi:hypothetical protein
MDRVVEERIAQNDATFRNANERIGAAAGAYDVKTPIPFICECADPTCMEIVRLELDQYEEIRANSRRFFNIPGHEDLSEGSAVVIAEREGYVIVEMTGHAGEVVEALDERKPDEGLERATAGEQ